MSNHSMGQARFLDDRATALSIFAGLAFFLLYAAVLLYEPALGVIDDWLFLDTIYSGRPYPPRIWPEVGRFYPLSGQEYNLVSLLSTEPFWFYAFNLAELLVFVPVALRVSRLVGLESKYALLGLAVFLLTPGFVSAWFRLLVPERGSTLFFLLFVWLYLEARESGKARYLILSVVAANVALYYKEPGILLVGTFAATNLMFSWSSLSWRFRAANAALLAGVAGYLTVYVLAVYLQRGDAMYGGVGLIILSRLVRNVGKYALNDPLLIFVLIPFSIARLWRLVAGKASDPGSIVFDAMLFASASYVLAYFAMGLYNTFYLLPAYVFALPALAFFIVNGRYGRLPVVRASLAAVAVVLAANTLPAGLNLVSKLKYVPINYQGTLDFLAGYVGGVGRDSTRVFLDGLPPDRDVEIFWSFRTNLESRGIASERFTLASTVGKIGSAQWSWIKAFPVPEETEVRPGDLLVVTPFVQVPDQDAYLAALARTHELVFATNSPLAIPSMTLHGVIKALFVSWPFARELLDIDGKPSAGWPEFYVFRAR